MRTRLLAGLSLLTLALPVIAAAASNSDKELRDCLRTALLNREQRMMDITLGYHQNWKTTLENRRIQLFDSWNVDVDRDRKNIQRDVEKNVANSLRDMDRNYKNETKTFFNEHKAEEKRCTDAWKEREKGRKNVPQGRQCIGSDECFAPLGICTVEMGDCKKICKPGVEPCSEVCSGICVIR